MKTELFIAVVAGLGGMLGWGLADFFAKKTIDKIGDVVTLAWGHIFGTIVLLAMALFQFRVLGEGSVWPHSLSEWLLLGFFGALQAAVYLLVYKGFGKGQVGLLSPVFASFSGLTAVVSVVVFNEVLGGSLLVGLIIVFAGIVLINVDVQALRARRLSFVQIQGFKEIACATVLATIWTVLWDRFIGGKDWLVYTFFMYLLMTVVILVVSYAQGRSLFVVKQSIWKYLFFIGLFETIAYLAISVGYGATSFTSVVALLSGAFSLPTIILARMFLGEKITTIQTIGSLVTIGGIMLLAAL